jgi:hypothetical protein
MGLWRFVTAQKIRCIEHCKDEIIEFLRRVKPSESFMPDSWKHFPAFVKLIPRGDILPARAKYSSDSNDWQVGINHLYAEGEKCGETDYGFLARCGRLGNPDRFDA